MQYEYTAVLLTAGYKHVTEVYRNSLPKVAQFSLLYLKPQLDEYGADGWELVSLEPVIRGDNDDLMVGATSSTHQKFWTHDYLATFKRVKPTPT